MDKKCVNCGMVLTDEDKYCKACGKCTTPETKQCTTPQTELQKIMPVVKCALKIGFALFVVVNIMTIIGKLACLEKQLTNKRNK